MGNRRDLQAILEKLLGSRNVYFQPPTSTKMKYPAIVYSRKDIDNIFANNGVYMQSHAYVVTVIDRNPDSEIVRKVSQLPMTNYERQYVSDNLYHDVFTLYF